VGACHGLNALHRSHSSRLIYPGFLNDLTSVFVHRKLLLFILANARLDLHHILNGNNHVCACLAGACVQGTIHCQAISGHTHDGTATDNSLDSHRTALKSNCNLRNVYYQTLAILGDQHQ